MIINRRTFIGGTLAISLAGKLELPEPLYDKELQKYLKKIDEQHVISYTDESVRVLGYELLPDEQHILPSEKILYPLYDTVTIFFENQIENIIIEYQYETFNLSFKGRHNRFNIKDFLKTKVVQRLWQEKYPFAFERRYLGQKFVIKSVGYCGITKC